MKSLLGREHTWNLRRGRTWSSSLQPSPGEAGGVRRDGHERHRRDRGGRRDAGVNHYSAAQHLKVANNGSLLTGLR
jgi:hypothetical protein